MTGSAMMLTTVKEGQGKPMSRTRLVGTAALMLAATAAPAKAAPAVSIEKPTAHGVVHFGQRVQVELTGNCKKAASRVTMRFGTGSVTGKIIRGCSPVVMLPTERAAVRRGYKP